MVLDHLPYSLQVLQLDLGEVFGKLFGRFRGFALNKVHPFQN